MASDNENSCRVEEVANRPADTHVPTVLTIGRPHITGSPVYVVSQGIHDNHGTIWPETFVAELLEAFVAATFGFFDSTVNDMLRHIIGLSTINDKFQFLVTMGIWIALFSSYVNFNPEFCVDLTVIGIQLGFFFFDVGPFTSHSFTSLSLKILLL